MRHPTWDREYSGYRAGRTPYAYGAIVVGDTISELEWEL